MDKSKYTLSLGAKEVTLVFTWGGVKRLKEILNADPLVKFTQIKDTTDLVEFSTGVIAACSGTPKEEISGMIDELTPAEVVKIASEVIKAFNNAFDIEAGGETGENTQGKAA